MTNGTTEQILLAWEETLSIKSVEAKTGISWNKIVKTLSSEGIIINDTHKKILEHYKDNKTPEQISNLMKISIKTVKSYLPRVRPIYNENLSVNALRIIKCRKQKKIKG